MSYFTAGKQLYYSYIPLWSKYSVTVSVFHHVGAMYGEFAWDKPGVAKFIMKMKRSQPLKSPTFCEWPVGIHGRAPLSLTILDPDFKK